MRKLIVNADDFGLTTSVNNGIIKAFSEGIVTTTSLMANGIAFDDAVLLAKKYPLLDVGIHIVLIEEKSVLPKEEIPSLVDNDSKFPTDYKDFFKKLLFKKISLNDIELEIKAQIEKILTSHIKISHIDSHQHIHMYPSILQIVIKVAKEYNIYKIRVPYERWRRKARMNIFHNILSLLSKRNKIIVTNEGLKTPDFFYGARVSGSLTKSFLTNILNNLPDGISEIMSHPGNEDSILIDRYGDWGFNWKQELDVLTDKEIKDIILEGGILLISYSNF